MKNKRLILGLLLPVLIGLIACNRVTAQQYDSAEDFRVAPLNGDREVSIIRYEGNKQRINIPPRIDGKPVVEIGDEAFQRREIISVTIPNSVTTIGREAFAGNQLTSVTIGANVEIDRRAFDDFDNFYNSQGRRAGTYTLSNGSWSVR